MDVESNVDNAENGKNSEHETSMNCSLSKIEVEIISINKKSEVTKSVSRK